ncbi:molybdate-anion transporter [Phanerochaete sordida]|uniref:Molybdate-anion transporter n=1 Tax=Phanerochaete sordida TaxID=48140 RepID=A0A9P3FZU6_9APHY|nr:molybdate-anion transporter [Phanerochaete sordida]
MLSFYELQLVYFAAACALWLLVDHLLAKRNQNASAERESLLNNSSSARWRLARSYLIVYGIVMGADWLQGPYVYSLYQEQYAFPERLVALLFVTGFMTAGLTAPLVGAWADTYGRKRLCQVFCVTYALACLFIQVPILPVLLFGRVLGGISTSILYSAFESWLISSSNNLMLPQSDLSSILGRATLLNGFVATGAGVFSNKLVGWTGSYASPFIASGLLLVLAYLAIQGAWTENYGAPDTTSESAGSIFQAKRLAQAWHIVRSDPHLLVIGLTQTCFEGSMYLFVFLWVPSLQEAAGTRDALPLGYIFSCFMVAMMLGSLLYTTVTALFSRSEAGGAAGLAQEEPLVLHAKLSSLVCAAAALAFAVTIACRHDEHVRFWAFCAFEACVGMYYPVQGMLRGSLISNEHRATLSSLFRVPLNVFVVVSLLTGVSSARDKVLTACAAMLGFSSLMTAGVIVTGLDRRRAAEPAGRPA